MKSGWDHWEYLKDNSSFTEEDLTMGSYRDLLYYSVSMADSNLKTYPFRFDYDDTEVEALLREGDREAIRDFLMSSNLEEIELALSSVGADIWERMDGSPVLRFVKIEDLNHIFLQYWLRTGTTHEYHERRGESIEFPIIRRISCRIHLDDRFMELRGRDDRKTDREVALRQIEKLFDNEITIRNDGLEIRDETIRYFLNLDGFVRRLHAKKAGTTVSSWSASDRDVAADSMFPTERPNEQSNFRFQIDNISDIGFQLSVENNSFRDFFTKDSATITN